MPLATGATLYDEFVSEPAEFAARGYTDVHKDTTAELSTVLFLGVIPVLLGLGWWWRRRVLALLRLQADALGKVDGNTLRRFCRGARTETRSTGLRKCST